MNPNKETIETWNKVALIYQEKFMNFDLYNPSYDLFCNLLKNNEAEILEMGCGPGNITRYLLNKNPRLKILGTDVASNMIDLAKENNPGANFLLMDARKASDLKTKFHAIISGFCLPYLSTGEVLKLISDCRKLLFNNGILYLSYVEGDPANSGFKTGSSGDRVYFYYHNLETIKQHLCANGFILLQHLELKYKSNETIETHSVVIARSKGK